MTSTSKRPEKKSTAAFIASLPPDQIEEFLAGLSPNAVAALPFLFEIWGHPGHQLPPEGAWITWLILGGRGAGKTRAGSEWIRAQVEGATPLETGKCSRVALVAETIDQAVEIMIRGDSGILACTPDDRRPEYITTRKALIWPNGAEAVCFSASNPEALRGPQFDCAWSDELAKWKKGRETWNMLQLGLRLGDRPQQVVTTTPRANPLLEQLLEDESTVVTSAPTRANRANLASSFLQQVEKAYGGTALGRQELAGEMVLERPGALWTRANIEAIRCDRMPDVKRIVVAVDPPATSGAGADECGVVVAALGVDDCGYVLADKSSQGESPQTWAARVVKAYHEFGADRIIAEVNQGGDLVEAMIRQVDKSVSYRAVRATRGKATRAEPISALYEQGRIRHFGAFTALEDQMCAFGANDGECRSPDRVDALVWAMTDLMLRTGSAGPRARRL